MARFLKVLLTVLVAACVLVLFTYGFLAVQGGRRVKAWGVQALLAVTVYSPFYWLLVAVILAILWWLCRRWLF